MTLTAVTARMALITGCALLVLSGRAQAEVFPSTDNDTSNRRLIAVDPRFAVAKLSTLGTGYEYRLGLGDTTALRLEQFVRTEQQSVSKSYYNYKLYGRLQSNSVILDWYPFRGAFRAGAGIIVSNPDLSATGTTNGSTTLSVQITHDDLSHFLARPDVQQFLADHNQFLADHHVDIAAAASSFTGASASTTINYTGLINANASVSWNRIAPYLGFGWSNIGAGAKGIVYSADVGAMYIGRPKVQLSVSGPVADVVNRYYGAELQTYLDGERQQLEDKLERYRVLPVVSLGLSYRF